MLREIYRLFQYTINTRVPEIKYISLYNRQFENIEGEREFDFPAVLIQIYPVRMNDLQQGIQQCVAQVRLHLGSTIYTGLELGDSGQDDSLLHLSILDKLYKELNNIDTHPDNYTFSGATGAFYISNTRRMSMETTFNTSSLRTSYIDFECFVTDRTAREVEHTLTGHTFDIIFSGSTY